MQTQTNNGIKTVLAILVVLFLGLSLWLFISNQRTAKELKELASRESGTATESFTDSTNTTDISELQAKTDALEQKLTDTAASTEAGSEAQGEPGLQGAAGVRGATGAQGVQGQQGAQGQPGQDGCLAGLCVSLQPDTPGTAEDGNINITGTLIAGNLQGGGADITNVDAVYLSGYNAGHFTNASNISSGTLADGRLSSNVVLKDAANTLTSTLQLTAAGTALSVTNDASIGNLTVVTAANIGGSLTVSGAGIFNGSLTFGTTLSGSCQGLSGYVWVPGSAKYGTLPGFCVMQYEAKNDGSNVAVSTESGAPWVSINQNSARDRAREACAGCHLITEAEWMTIAENAAFVNVNWSGGTVGSGCLFRGNVGNNDACGYDGANPENGPGRDQKAKLTLSNGSEIWDISGNVWEWTDAYITQNEQPSVSTITDGSAAYREYTAINQWKGLHYMKPPVDTWSATQGIGRIYSYSNDTLATTRGFIRGGYWHNASYAGAFALYLSNAPADTHSNVGFRVAR